MSIKRKKIAGAFLGTIVEYYDYSLYGFSANILREKFFPDIDYISGLMHVFAIYFISYCAKPLGSLFFSKIGDKYGRKASLKITMIGIVVPTVTIGLLPDYNSIGVLAIQILVLCRFFQGFFVAGEYDGAAIYVIEHLGKEHQYTASAITRSTGVIGLLLGIAVTNFFNSTIFPDWCWRVPFLLSFPLAVVTIYYRTFLEETPVFLAAQKESIQFNNLLGFIRKQWRVLVLIILLSGGFGVTYQVSIIFMKQYLPLVIPEAKAIISTFSIIIVMGFGAAMPVSGIFADYYGKLFVFKCTLVLTILSAILISIAVQFQLLNLALISCLLLAISVAPFNALAHGVIIQAFKSKERYRGVGLGHTIGSLLMSGSANYICLLVIKNTGFMLFPILYIVLFAILAFYMILQISSNIDSMVN